LRHENYGASNKDHGGFLRPLRQDNNT